MIPAVTRRTPTGSPIPAPDRRSKSRQIRYSHPGLARRDAARPGACSHSAAQPQKAVTPGRPLWFTMATSGGRRLDLPRGGAPACVRWPRKSCWRSARFRLETARRISRQLVAENFAACANIVPAIESIYRWQGKIEEGNETLVLFKTTAARSAAFQEKLKTLHPYDVPEIICLRSPGIGQYLRWVAGIASLSSARLLPPHTKTPRRSDSRSPSPR